MGHRRRISKDVEQHYEADKELAASYSEAAAAAERTERELRTAQAAGAAFEDLRTLAADFDQALLVALQAAEAARRAEMGPRTYPQGEGAQRRKAEMAARRARAKSSVRVWTAEADRLRTLREEHKLTFRPETPAIS